MAGDKREIPWSKCRWRIDHANKEKTRGYYVPYFDARAVAEQLDEWLGWDGWSDEYQVIGPTGKKDEWGVLCIITVYRKGSATNAMYLDPPITKSGMAEFTTFETIKGGESGAFKRAGAKLGVGREIYKTRGVWAPIARRGDKVYPADNVEQYLNKQLSEQLGEELELEVEKPAVDEHVPPAPVAPVEHPASVEPEEADYNQADTSYHISDPPDPQHPDIRKYTNWAKGNVFKMMGGHESTAKAAYESALRAENLTEELDREQALQVMVRVRGQINAARELGEEQP